MEATQPIPLRTLTLLLNYERMTTDPRFQNQSLLESSVADPKILEIAKEKIPALFKHQCETTIRTNIVQLQECTTTSSPDGLPTIFSTSPDASPEVQALTIAQRESIYHEVTGHDGCYQAIGLYQQFFDLCPRGQLLSIQVASEVGKSKSFCSYQLTLIKEPIQVGVGSWSILEFGVVGPKLQSICMIPSRPLTTITGAREGEAHAVLGFAYPGSQMVNIVVDMTRLQYGDIGRGMYGESYFIGSTNKYFQSMEDKICTGLENKGTASRMNPRPDNTEEDSRLRACAEKVWKRWQNRDQEGWCAHCGMGGEKLMRCTGCKSAKVWYCGKEHQVAGWKLHKHTCEKKK